MTLGGKTLPKDDPIASVKAGLARTFQNIRVFGTLTVIENVVLAAMAMGDNRRTAFARAARELVALDLCDLADRPADALSYGPKRRLEIARALALQPSLLLLDEPAAGMNPAETEDLRRRLKSIAEDRGIAILLIDHDLPFVMGLSAEVVVMDHGRVIAIGTPQEVQNNPAVIEAYIGAPEATTPAGEIA